MLRAVGCLGQSILFRAIWYEVAIGDLLECQLRLKMMASFLGRHPFRVRDYAVSAALKPPCRIGVPIVVHCKLGDRLLTVVGALVGDCDGEGPDADGYYKLRISNPEPRVFERACRPAASTSFDSKGALRQAVKAVEALGLDCILAAEYESDQMEATSD